MKKKTLPHRAEYVFPRSLFFFLLFFVYRSTNKDVAA